MPVYEGTLSDIKGNAASGSHLQYAQQCLIYHAVAAAAGTSLYYALIRSKKHWIMLAGSRTTYAHNRIMHLNDMHLSKVTSY